MYLSSHAVVDWVWLVRPACICLASGGLGLACETSMYLSSQGWITLPPLSPHTVSLHLHLSTPSLILSYLPPISTVTDDEACEPLRLVVASPSSLPAAARLLQQLEHNQVGLLTAATHIVAISAPRGPCLHLCVGRYSCENLNQTTTSQTRTHTAYD